MKNLLTISFFILFLIILSVRSTHFLKNSKSILSTNTTMLSSSNEIKQSNDFSVKGCSSLNAILNRFRSFSDNISAKKGSDFDMEWRSSIESFIRDPIFVDFENSSLQNNKCGAASSSLLLYLYSQTNQKDKREVVYNRLAGFASNNNDEAIKLLCNLELPENESIKYCEIIINNENNPAFRNSIKTAEIILSGYYYRSKKANSLINLCDKITEKMSCQLLLSSIAEDFYSEQKFKEAFNIYDSITAYDYSGISQLHIAEMYQKGEGIARNPNAAIYWYKKALEKIRNSELKPGIINDMGVAYDELMDHISAFQCYQFAARLGFPLAQLNLAKSYSAGTGVLPDNVQAYAWVSIAIAKGLENREEELEAEKFKNYLSFVFSLQDKNGYVMQKANTLAQLYYKEYVLNEKPETKIKESQN